MVSASCWEATANLAKTAGRVHRMLSRTKAPRWNATARTATTMAAMITRTPCRPWLWTDRFQLLYWTERFRKSTGAGAGKGSCGAPQGVRRAGRSGGGQGRLLGARLRLDVARPPAGGHRAEQVHSLPDLRQQAGVVRPGRPGLPRGC